MVKQEYCLDEINQIIDVLYDVQYQYLFLEESMDFMILVDWKIIKKNIRTGFLGFGKKKTVYVIDNITCIKKDDGFIYHNDLICSAYGVWMMKKMSDKYVNLVKSITNHQKYFEKKYNNKFFFYNH